MQTIDGKDIFLLLSLPRFPGDCQGCSMVMGQEETSMLSK